ncbi:hypothetical protein [Flammeovirga aprica]|uniref:Uncharacterized protein n=1 Tax=Flammeovirga aprica JL-4 TaxID=694437 RepID=A0A7X9XBZ6_9BACT|nr:hypothetical protein [Flammeovirga aprica]NME71261.1 hypothetical protein [Flammeovirga aprica JL-4]
MKKLLLIFMYLVISESIYGQGIRRDQIIELGKYYSSYMFMNEPPKSAKKELDSGFDDELRKSIDFIQEGAKSKNKLLTKEFLMLPDTTTLKVVYIIDALHQNPHRVDVREPKDLVDSLLTIEIPLYELIDEYYSTLFTAVGNKNKPFNLSKIDFHLKEYGLDSDRARGIFYLRCMELCGSQIFGYMNIVNPPNTKKALDYINKFPKFNGSEYFRYTDLYFNDFEIEILNNKGKQSYKDYYVGKLYSTLLNHLICLDKESNDREKITELLLGSILKDSSLYKHTSHKATLEGIFKKQ